ncbi:putative RNA helicase transcription factor interactor and regulator CCHC(Zn) family [Dioscorea sansibarensis]
MIHTGGIDVPFPDEWICEVPANDTDALQRNTLMWLFTKIVIFLGTLQLSALKRLCAGLQRTRPHTASNCPNEGMCHSWGKPGHCACGCRSPELPTGDLRICKKCHKQGHFAADCTNEEACKNCRKTLNVRANEPVCNLCNISGHDVLGGRIVVHYRGALCNVVCRNCDHGRHMHRDCMGPRVICHNCGADGHLAYECSSDRFMDRMHRRY